MTTDEILSELEACKTADEVADLCRKHGVKAFPGEAASCAIACLVEQSEGIKYVEVFPKSLPGDHGEIQVWDGSDTAVRPLTPAASEFAYAFDDECYPDLIDPSADDDDDDEDDEGEDDWDEDDDGGSDELVPA